MSFHPHITPEPGQDGQIIAAWEHYYDDERCQWVVTVRWSHGITQIATFTEEELGEIDALHRVRALLP
jgi:hypothetical protein